MKKRIITGLSIGIFLGVASPSHAFLNFVKTQKSEEAREREKACEAQAEEMLKTDEDGKLTWGKRDLSPKTWVSECARAKVKNAPDPTDRNPKPYYQ